MKLKLGYKRTDVGIIPNDWEVSSFKEQFRICAGGDLNPALSASEQDEIHPYPIYSNAITNRGLYGYCSYADHPACSITVTARGKLGFAAYRAHKYTAIGRVLVLEPRQEASGQFFTEFINSRIRFAVESTGVPQLTAPQIGRYLLAVPPYHEQRAIAAALNDVDALLDGLDRLIAKKRGLKQAAVQQLMAGQTRLPGFHGEWEMITLGELEQRGDIKLFRGKVISQKDIDRLPGDYPIYSSSVHFSGLFGSYGEYMFDEELITWSVDGGGHFFHRPKHRFSVTNVCGYLRIRTSAIDYRYFAYQLQHLHSRVVFDYTVKAHPSVIRGVYTVALPEPSEQRAIATVLSDMDAEIAALEARRDKTRDLKQAMMVELLTGKTRLVEPEAPHA